MAMAQPDDPIRAWWRTKMVVERRLVSRMADFLRVAMPPGYTLYYDHGGPGTCLNIRLPNGRIVSGAVIDTHTEHWSLMLGDTNLEFQTLLGERAIEFVAPSSRTILAFCQGCNTAAPAAPVEVVAIDD
jgi:hypothetical protein